MNDTNNLKGILTVFATGLFIGATILLILIHFDIISAFSIGPFEFEIPTQEVEVTRIIEVEVPQEQIVEVTRMITETTTEIITNTVEIPVTVEVLVPSESNQLVLTPAVTVMVVTATPTPLPTLSPDTLFVETFEDGNANGWNSPTPNDWDVVEIGEQFEFTCISARTQYGDQELIDYRVSADMRTINNDVNMGVIGRYVDGNLFYLANLNGSEAKILRKRTNGRWTDLGIVGYEAIPDTVYNVALDMQGTILTMFVNGEQVLQVEDAIIGSGKFGVRCGDNTQAAFDNVLVESR